MLQYKKHNYETQETILHFMNKTGDIVRHYKKYKYDTWETVLQY